MQRRGLAEQRQPVGEVGTRDGIGGTHIACGVCVERTAGDGQRGAGADEDGPPFLQGPRPPRPSPFERRDGGQRGNGGGWDGVWGGGVWKGWGQVATGSGGFRMSAKNTIIYEQICKYC